MRETLQLVGLPLARTMGRKCLPFLTDKHPKQKDENK
jgi:hypothetical protein